MNEGPESRYDRFTRWWKNNPVTTAMVIIGTLLIAVSTFTNSMQNLWNLFRTEVRAPVNGEWTAEVTYDWPGADYSETFVFEGSDDKLFGTATYLKRKRTIENGTIEGDRIQFTTRTKEISGDWNNAREVTHRYTGVVENGQIRFTLQSDGGFSVHSPVEFIAQRVREDAE